MGINTYFTSLNKLEQLRRVPGEFVLEAHDVAGHSLKVAHFIQYFGEREQMLGASINWKSLYEKAINHDYGETLTGDIKTPVKYATTELKKLIDKVESEMLISFVKKEFPEEMVDLYLEKFKEGKDETVEGKLLALADKLDQLYEAFNEIRRGNNDGVFINIYMNALITIKKIELRCIQHFMEDVLPEILNEEINSGIDLRKITEDALSRNESVTPYLGE